MQSSKTRDIPSKMPNIANFQSPTFYEQSHIFLHWYYENIRGWGREGDVLENVAKIVIVQMLQSFFQEFATQCYAMFIGYTKILAYGCFILNNVSRIS